MSHPLRYGLEYILLRGLLGVYGLMPTQTASALGGAIFRAVGPITGISRVARRNLRATFPEWNDAQVEDTLKGMWDNLGRVVAEYPHMDDIARNRTTFIDPEKITIHPAVYVSGHLANWEVLPPALWIQHRNAMHSVYRAPNNPFVDALIVKYRGFGGALRSFGKNRRGLADTMKALQSGDCVGMLIDQKMNTGIEAEFFGRPAMTSTAFVELCRKIGCPLIPVVTTRLPHCRFVVTGFDPIPVDGRMTEDVVAEMHRKLESWITAHPQQWLWLHRRWKQA